MKAATPVAVFFFAKKTHQTHHQPTAILIAVGDRWGLSAKEKKLQTPPNGAVGLGQAEPQSDPNGSESRAGWVVPKPGPGTARLGRGPPLADPVQPKGEPDPGRARAGCRPGPAQLTPVSHGFRHATTEKGV